MAKYELSGEWYSPPDRGSPNGDWNWFKHHFESESDSAATQMFKEHLGREYPACERKDFKNLRLIRYEEVNLAPVLV